jgi:hypothetical protein
MTAIECTLYKDADFPPTHPGIRLSKDKQLVDVLDCLTFVCSSYGAAKMLKAKLFSRVGVFEYVWAGSKPARKRVTCAVVEMVKALSRCQKPEAAVLSTKLVALTSVSVAEVEECALPDEPADAPTTEDAQEVEQVDTSRSMATLSTSSAAVVPLLDQSSVLALSTAHDMAFDSPHRKRDAMSCVFAMQRTAMASMLQSAYHAAESDRSVRTAVHEAQMEKVALDKQQRSDEHNHAKRMRDLDEQCRVNEAEREKKFKETKDSAELERANRKATLGEIEQKIEFFKRVGNQEMVDATMAVYSAF